MLATSDALLKRLERLEKKIDMSSEEKLTTCGGSSPSASEQAESPILGEDHFKEKAKKQSPLKCHAIGTVAVARSNDESVPLERAKPMSQMYKDDTDQKMIEMAHCHEKALRTAYLSAGVTAQDIYDSNMETIKTLGLKSTTVSDALEELCARSIARKVEERSKPSQEKLDVESAPIGHARVALKESVFSDPLSQEHRSLAHSCLHQMAKKAAQRNTATPEKLDVESAPIGDAEVELELPSFIQEHRSQTAHAYLHHIRNRRKIPSQLKPCLLPEAVHYHDEHGTLRTDGIRLGPISILQHADVYRMKIVNDYLHQVSTNIEAAPSKREVGVYIKERDLDLFTWIETVLKEQGYHFELQKEKKNLLGVPLIVKW